MRGWTVWHIGSNRQPNHTEPLGLSSHIGSFQNLELYLITNPLFFWAALKREAGTLFGSAYILYYCITGECFAYFNSHNVGVCITYTLLYNYSRNPDWGPSISWLWVVPGLLFYNSPLSRWSIFGFWSPSSDMGGEHPWDRLARWPSADRPGNGGAILGPSSSEWALLVGILRVWWLLRLDGTMEGYSLFSGAFWSPQLCRYMA